ncbi:MAG: universal stress protein [Actinobacteria bacterium]|nr:universal stress protein [Actinomycetota bacterium]
MAYEKIVVGTDGSETAKVAERVASHLASAMGAELIVATARSKDSSHRSEKAISSEEIVGVQTRLEHGEPAEVLVRVAEQELAGLLVIGNKGMGGGGLSLLGNVPNKVSHHAPCDLLIVNTSRVGRASGYDKVLVATDGSPTADIAVRRAHAISNSLGASLSLMSVGPDAKKVLTGAIEEHKLFDVEVIEDQGDPASKLCEAAEARGFDLIVVGNKGMSGSKRFLLGSVPNKVSHYALCDVLIARTISRSISDLRPGEGGVVLANGERVAAYKEDDGSLVAVSAKCTHMGCTVAWNGDEKTWDCPCHGSRYDLQGKVIRGPASRDLAPLNLGIPQ